MYIRNTDGTGSITLHGAATGAVDAGRWQDRGDAMTPVGDGGSVHDGGRVKTTGRVIAFTGNLLEADRPALEAFYITGGTFHFSDDLNVYAVEMDTLRSRLGDNRERGDYPAARSLALVLRVLSVVS